MKIDIARQPLVPAFFTLLLLALTAVHGSDIAASATPATTPAPLAVATPEELLLRLQTAFPVWSRVISLLLLLFSGMCIGRITVRYNLYSVGSCLAIPLFGIGACLVAKGPIFLGAFVAATLTALVLKHFCRAFCNGYAFDAIFRASFYLGTLPLVSPAALPLLLLLPLALLLFRRTTREAVVASVGLILPGAIFCYANWGAGGAFFAPLVFLTQEAVSGLPLAFPQSLSVVQAGFAATLLLLCIAAVTLFSTNVYTVGTKPRFILVFAVCTLVLAILALAGPAASYATLASAIVPAAVLIPLFFIRMRPGLALAIYLGLLGFAVFIQTIQ